MKEKHSKDEFAHLSPDLRNRAEEVILKKEAPMTEALEFLSPQDVRKTLHELRVHQIELQMQNKELQMAQEALDLAKTRYFDLYDMAPVSYLSLDGKGIILEANLTATTLLGAAKSSLVTRPLSQYILPEDQDIYYRCRKQLLEIGKPQSCELRMVKSDGTIFFVHLESIAIADPEGMPEWRVTLSDITKRLRYEEAIRERMKELNCLYSISTLVEKEPNPEKLFQAVVELLPGGWLHTKLACARILLGKQEFKTANFNPSAWSLTADIILNGKPGGVVELFYSEAGSFLEEERKLIQAIAERLGRVADRLRVDEDLRKKVEELERFSKISIGRELKMIELKEKLKAFEKERGAEG